MEFLTIVLRFIPKMMMTQPVEEVDSKCLIWLRTKRRSLLNGQNWMKFIHSQDVVM